MFKLTDEELIEYEGGIPYDKKAGDDFRRRLAINEALGLVVSTATQEEWDEALAKFRKENSYV
jgi:hypothetical protein